MKLQTSLSLLLSFRAHPAALELHEILWRNQMVLAQLKTLRGMTWQQR